jgi:hypothetical protein
MCNQKRLSAGGAAHMMRGPVFGIDFLRSRQQIRVQGVAMPLLEDQ